MPATAIREGAAAFAVVVSILFLHAGALAQDAVPAPKAPAAPPTTTPPDLVQLKNGGMVRGTISEVVPGQQVVIVTITGEARAYSMAEVVYAGPASGAPARASAGPAPPAAASAPAAPAPKQKGTATTSRGGARPLITVHAEEARFRLTGNPESLTFHLKTATGVAYGSGGGSATAAAFTEICTTPCEASLPAGTHTFAVSQEDDSPVVADPVKLDPGPTSLHAEYHDRSGGRIAGYVIGIAASIAGLGILASSDTGSGGFWGGFGLALGGPLVGVIVVSASSDGVTLEPR